MDLTPRDVHQKQFHDAWRGYNQEEVDDFLDKLAESLDRVTRENQMLRQRSLELEQTVATSREAEEMLKKTLVTAQQAAEEAIGKAKAKAEQLITEAEQRARGANEEARERVAAAEVDIRRKTIDADRDFLTHKRELDASIDRLRSFESELKQRLKQFMEQQLRALEVLAEKEPPVVRTPATVQPQRAAAAQPQSAPAPKPAPAARTSDQAPGGTPQAEAAPPTHQRRTMRNLFARDEGASSS